MSYIVLFIAVYPEYLALLTDVTSVLNLEDQSVMWGILLVSYPKASFNVL